MNDLTNVGSYTDSPSPYRTFDQGCNVWQWTYTLVTGSNRVLRGGTWFGAVALLAASSRNDDVPSDETYGVGFRVAPEPSTGLLQVTELLGLLDLAGWRRSRA